MLSSLLIPVARRKGFKCGLRSGDKGVHGGSVVKNPPPNAGDTSSVPGPERSHMSQSN